MTQLPNQFTQSPEKGDLDLIVAGQVLSCLVYGSETPDLVYGQAVKLKDVAGALPVVTALAADTDASFGFVSRNMKDADFPAASRVEIAISGSVMYMEAGAAIARGAKLEVVNATKKVITNAGVNPVMGLALDKAAADGDLIRVMIITNASFSQAIADIAGLQTALYNRLQTFRVTATLAELNAGKEIVPAVAGKKIRVHDYTARVVGNFATNTSADLQSGTTGTKVTALAVAGLTNGAILQPSSGNTTLGAGFAADLETGENMKVSNTGAAATGGTSITFTVAAAYV